MVRMLGRNELRFLLEGDEIGLRIFLIVAVFLGLE
jgi:hypothetical protein